MGGHSKQVEAGLVDFSRSLYCCLRWSLESETQAIMTRGAWNPLVGRIELETVEIDTRGYFNAEKKYWPVKAKITTKKTRQIAVLDFQIFKDDYGKWSARPAERQ
jgi:hypothetical protein